MFDLPNCQMRQPSKLCLYVNLDVCTFHSWIVLFRAFGNPQVLQSQSVLFCRCLYSVSFAGTRMADVMVDRTVCMRFAFFCLALLFTMLCGAYVLLGACAVVLDPSSKHVVATTKHRGTYKGAQRQLMMSRGKIIQPVRQPASVSQPASSPTCHHHHQHMISNVCCHAGVSVACGVTNSSFCSKCPGHFMPRTWPSASSVLCHAARCYLQSTLWTPQPVLCHTARCYLQSTLWTPQPIPGHIIRRLYVGCAALTHSH